MSENYRVEGLVASFPDDRDFFYQPRAGAVPSAVDLKPDVFEVDNQLSIGSCTANAVTSAIELLLKSKKQDPKSLSRLFLYWNTRNIIEDRAGQEGAVLRNAVRSAYHQGVCFETMWPYVESNSNTKPSQESYDQVRTNDLKVKRYERVQINTNQLSREVILNGIKSALADGLPVIWAGLVGQQLYSLRGPWKEQNYSSVTTQGNPSVGGHAMLIIGYDDSCQKFLVENSWGSGWGDGGFCGIPYNVIIDDAFEAWVIRGFKDAWVEPNAGPTVDPLTINVENRYEVYDENPTANPTIMSIPLNAVGGVRPLKLDWTDISLHHSFDESTNTVQLQYWWSPNETVLEKNYVLRVRDSNVANPSVVESRMDLKFVRGQSKPQPAPTPEPTPQPQPDNGNSDKKSNTGVIIGVVVALIIAVVAYFGL
jgi:hypothetical protein